MYANKADIARIFGTSKPTVYRRCEEIKQEIGKRYNRYAMIDNLISAEVYADFEKYRKRLADKNMRKTVPPFNMAEASEYLECRAKEGRMKLVTLDLNRRKRAAIS